VNFLITRFSMIEIILPVLNHSNKKGKVGTYSLRAEPIKPQKWFLLLICRTLLLLIFSRLNNMYIELWSAYKCGLFGRNLEYLCFVHNPQFSNIRDGLDSIFAVLQI
jgi:hypothetical protein